MSPWVGENERWRTRGEEKYSKFLACVRGHRRDDEKKGKNWGRGKKIHGIEINKNPIFHRNLFNYRENTGLNMSRAFRSIHLSFDSMKIISDSFCMRAVYGSFTNDGGNTIQKSRMQMRGDGRMIGWGTVEEIGRETCSRSLLNRSVSLRSSTIFVSDTFFPGILLISRIISKSNILFNFKYARYFIASWLYIR